jgi:uncharacterized membrane protein YhaH (DUF805 family)
MADYRGRSRRQEVAAFWLLTIAVGVALALATSQFGDWRDERVERIVYQLVLVLPVAPLVVRRLHDAGYRGWWVLLGLPSVVVNVWRDYVDYLQPIRPTSGPWEAAWIVVSAAVSLLALFLLVIHEGDPEPNRYGPNPRYDPPEPEAQGLA